MSKLSFMQWYRSVGELRISILIGAFLGYGLLKVYDPPYYSSEVSKAPLIAPFVFLVFLDIAWAAVYSIILVECVRTVTYRFTSAWSLRKYAVIVIALIAVVSLSNAMLSYSRKSMVYYNYGWSLAKNKEHDRALASLQIALQYNPKNINAFLERGYIHRELKDLTASLNDYNKVLEVDSNNAGGHEGKGYVFYYQGNDVDALKEWQTAITLDPQRSARLDKWIDAAKQKSKN